MIRYLRKRENSLFATQTVPGHLLRGGVAFGLLYAAVSQQHAHPGWSIMMGLLAFIAMRGCPACWTIGLLEALKHAWRQDRPAGGPAQPGCASALAPSAWVRTAQTTPAISSATPTSVSGCGALPRSTNA